MKQRRIREGGRRWWSLVTVCLTAIILALAVGQAGATIVPPVYITEFGEPGSGDGQFYVPFGVVVDSQGRILVVDNSNNRIRVFNSDYHYLTSWTGFNEPRALEIDHEGNVYVVEFWGHQLQKRAPDGTLLASWGLREACYYGGWWPGPTDLAIDSQGNIYVVKSEGNCVLKYDANMVFQKWWPAYDPISVAIDSQGNVFVGEAANRSIAEFDSEGNLLVRFGSYGTGDGEFNYPNSLWLDDNDRLYVADHINHRIQVFDSNNNFLTKWGEWGSGPGQFGWPDSIYVADDGRIFVSEQANSRVQIFAFQEPPLANGDNYSVNEDQVLTVAAPGVMTNDTDLNNDLLTAVKVSDPAYGSLVLSSDGSFIYIPFTNYSGADSFTYLANDGIADSNLATVSIIVNPVNDLPTAEAGGPYTVVQGNTVTLTGNGSDPDGDALTFAWDLDNDGVYETPGQNAVYTGAGAPQTYTVALQVCDLAGACATDTAFVTIQWPFAGFFPPVDNPPTLNSVKAGSAVPIKFSLGGDYGLGILAAGSPASQRVACDTNAPLDEIEQTDASGNSGLQYNSLTGQYSYVWKTAKSWAGTCRRLTLRLVDGTDHTANFKFK